MPRLPSLDSLQVFSVAARHLSFTAAATELHRTQSAVSHRIKDLEAEIGVLLFHRRPRGLELTRAGKVLADRLSLMIGEISRTVAELDRTEEARRLRITTLASVASRWLMPRLPRFCQQHPDIQVQVIAEPRVIDLRAENIDLAIRFGNGRYRGYQSTLLMGDRMLPVCHPQLIAGRRSITSVQELFELPLLHDSATEADASLSDWRSWLDQLGCAQLPCHNGQRFSHAGLAIEAAVHGLGIALARLSLAADHLASGALVCPLPLSTPTAFAYYLVALPEVAALPNTVLLTDWLRSEAEETAAIAARIRAEEARFRAAHHDPPSLGTGVA